MLAASIDDEQVSRPPFISLQSFPANKPYLQVRSRALGAKIKRKDGHPPPRPQLGIPSQHRSRQIHHPVRYHFSPPSHTQTTRTHSLMRGPTEGNKQLPNLLLHLLPHHLRPLLPAQTRLHLPLRPRHRIHNHLLLPTISLPHLPPLRLRRIRHLHPAHQENLPGLPRHAESG